MAWVADVIVFFAFLGIGWIVAIVAALWIAANLRQTWARVCIVVAAFVSVPIFILLTVLLQKIDDQNYAFRQQVITEKAAAIYTSLCSRPQQISVSAPLMVAAPVNVQVKEAPASFSLNLMQLDWPKKTHCWVDPAITSCPRPPIENVQWEFRSLESVCKASSPARGCYRAWNLSTVGGTMTEISAPDAPFVLRVSKTEDAGPFIEQFRIVLIDVRREQPVGETYVLRKSFRDPDENHRQPLHCPERDVALANLLNKALVLRR